MTDTRALVLFSGGQDSTTCLAWSLARFGKVETVGFEYGQRHSIEMEARQKVLTAIRAQFPKWGAKLGRDHVLSVDLFRQIGGTALTADMTIEMDSRGLPTTFVPGRNLIFLTAAAALGYRIECRDLVAGLCETDFSGYPDCRHKTMQALEQTISLGIGLPYTIHTPLMFIDKAATWRMAEQLGGAALVDIILEETATCYRGVRDQRHAWGYGCGDCPACGLRAEGYRRYLAK